MTAMPRPASILTHSGRCVMNLNMQKICKQELGY